MLSGLRFAKVQSMLCLAHFIKKIRVEQCERTTKDIKFDPQKMMLTAIDGIWLTLKRRALDSKN